MMCGCPEEFAKLERKGQLGIAIGDFGLIHAGTVRFLQTCRAKCDTLIAIVAPEATSPQNKKPVLLQADERLRVLRAFAEVDAVFLMNDAMSDLRGLAEAAQGAKWFVSAVEKPLPVVLEEALRQQGVELIQMGENEQCTTEAVLLRISR